ncbi:MAG: cysteine methyltransferase [Desulfuromonas sp.]|nr:MAG: cysteine methyltransferase [Desulfuromonas sp.]
MFLSEIDSPLGPLGIAAGDEAVIAVAFGPERQQVLAKLKVRGDESENRISRLAASQLREYFAGRRKQFALPVELSALTPFSQKVLNTLAEVPFGRQLTYGQLAQKAGRAGAARAIGRIMASNPIPLIIPCHRVIGAGGKMTGYSGGEGIKTKVWLLDFEAEKVS